MTNSTRQRRMQLAEVSRRAMNPKQAMSPAQPRVLRHQQATLKQENAPPQKQDGKKIEVSATEIVTQSIFELQQLQKISLIAAENDLMLSLNGCIERLAKKSFRVAVVGEFSAGKSTFLNALLQKDLLLHGSKETTAVITEIQNVEQPVTTFDAIYQDGKVQTDIPLEKLREYTTVCSKTIVVAKQLSRVILKHNIFNSDAELLFVDTPGLNGTAKGHREQTIAEIKRADACVYLLPIRGIAKSDFEFIDYLAHYQKNFVFVQNFIDRLEEQEGDTPENKIKEQEEILRGFFANFHDVSYQVIGISALQALSATDKDCAEHPSKTEECDALYRASRFETFKSSILQLIEKNEKQKLKQKAAITTAISELLWHAEIWESALQEQQKKWEHTTDASDAKQYSDLLEETKSSKEKTFRKLEQFIESQTDELYRKSKQGLRVDIQSAQTRLKETLDEIQDLATFEQYMQKNDFAHLVQQEVDLLSSKHCNYIETVLGDIFSNAFQELLQYVKVPIDEITMSSFSVTEIEDANAAQFEAENKITDKCTRIAKEELKTAEMTHEIGKAVETQRRLKRAIEQRAQQRSRVSHQRERKKQQHGCQPKPVQRMVEKETRYKRNFIGQLFLGDKIVKTQEPYWDYSAVDTWEKEMQEINETFNKTMRQIDANDRHDSTELRDAEQDEESLREELDRNLKSIERQKDVLAQLESYRATQKELNSQELLNAYKKQLWTQIDRYFESDDVCVLHTLLDYGKQLITQNKPQLIAQVRKYYEIAWQRRVQYLKSRLSKTQIPQQELKKQKEQIKKIIQIEKRLECLLCQLN